MKEILPYIYHAIITPEPDAPYEVNLYMVHDGKKTLFIDCGYDTQRTMQFYGRVFEDFSINPKTTTLFLTHYHIDHTGMSWWFQLQGADICIHEEEYEDAHNGLDRVLSNTCVTCGLHESEIAIMQNRDFGSKHYRPFFFDAHPLKGGEIFEVGPYQFEVVPLRGHTRAHTGLYDAKSGILFGGDHVLKGLAPIILAEGIDQHHLRTFYEHLDLVSSLNVNCVLPAHGPLMMDAEQVTKAIQKTKDSYDQLCDTVLEILKNSRHPLTAYQVNLKLYHKSRMEMRHRLGLSTYMMAQKILACLEFLYDQGKIQRTVQPDGMLFYEPFPEDKVSE